MILKTAPGIQSCQPTRRIQATLSRFLTAFHRPWNVRIDYFVANRDDLSHARNEVSAGEVGPDP